MVEHRRLPVDGDAMLGRWAEPILENLALAAACPPEPLRGGARGAVEGANEVREIVEPDIERDTGDGARILRQQARSAAQPGSAQLMMRSHAESAGEYPTKMKRPNPRSACNGDQSTCI